MNEGIMAVITIIVFFVGLSLGIVLGVKDMSTNATQKAYLIEMNKATYVNGEFVITNEDMKKVFGGK